MTKLETVKSVNTSAKPVRTGPQSTRTSRLRMKATHDDNRVDHSSTGKKALNPIYSTSKKALSPIYSTGKKALSPIYSTGKKALSPIYSTGKKALSPIYSTVKKALSPIYSESETMSPISGKRWKSIPLGSKQNTPRYQPSITNRAYEPKLIAKTMNQMKTETNFQSSLKHIEQRNSTPVKVEFQIKVNPKYANQNKSQVNQVVNIQNNNHGSYTRTVATIQDMIENVLKSLKTGKHFAKVDFSVEFKSESLERSLPGTARRLPIPVEITDISAIDPDRQACTPRFLDISHAENDIQYARSTLGPLHCMQGLAFTSRGSRFTPLMCSTPRVDELTYGVCEITTHGDVNWIEAEIVSARERQLLQVHAVAISKRPDDVPRLNIVVSPVGRTDKGCIEVYDDCTDLTTDRSMNLHRSRGNSEKDYPRPMTQVRPPFVPPLNLRTLEGYELNSKKKCTATFRVPPSRTKETPRLCQSARWMPL